MHTAYLWVPSKQLQFLSGINHYIRLVLLCVRTYRCGLTTSVIELVLKLLHVAQTLLLTPPPPPSLCVCVRVWLAVHRTGESTLIHDVWGGCRSSWVEDCIALSLNYLGPGVWSNPTCQVPKTKSGEPCSYTFIL